MIRQTHDFAADKRKNVEQWLRWYAALLIVLTSGAWAIAALQKTTLLYLPKQRFDDLTLFLDKTKHVIGHGASIFATPPQINYPAPSLFVYSFFANLPFNPLTGFLTLSVLGAVAGLIVLLISMARCGVSRSTIWLFGSAVLLTSYPMLIELDRANIEIVMWLLLLGAVVALNREKYWAGAILIAVAGSLKPFPLCLFALFLFWRRYREIAAGALVYLTITLAAFAITGPTALQSFRAYQQGTRGYNRHIAAAYRGMSLNFDHSVLGVFKQLTRAALGWPHSEKALNAVINRLYVPYFVLAAVAFFLSVLILRKRPVLNQWIGVISLMVVLPPAAYDYTLIHLYFPWALLIIYLCCVVARGETPASSKWIWALLVGFALVFTPQTYIRAHYIGFGGQVKCIFIIGLLTISLLVPLRDSRLDRMARAEV